MRTKPTCDLDRLANLNLALVEDILTMSDEELFQELREEGIDPIQVMENMREIFEKVMKELD